MRLADGRAAACLALAGPGCDGPGSVLVAGRSRLRPGTWQHVALRRAERQIALYVNGRLEGTGTHDPDSPNANLVWLRAGSGEFGNADLAGLIDEVEIYNRPLTDEEILSRLPELGERP